MRHAPVQLSPSPLSARDHPARNLAVSPLHLELSRCRGIAGRTRARHLLRNGAAMGGEVRSIDRATAAPLSGCRGLTHQEGFDLSTHRIGIGAEKVDEDYRDDESAGGADQRRVIGSRKIVDQAAEKPAEAGT